MTPTQFSKFEPLSWLIVFTTSTTMPWLDRVIPGRFRHVQAFGWVEASQVFLRYEVQLGRTLVMALPEKDGLQLIAQTIGRDPDVGVLRVPAGAKARAWGRIGFWCVPAIKHLVGLRSGALLPTRLWRDCITSGAEVVHDGRRTARAAIPADTAGN